MQEDISLAVAKPTQHFSAKVETETAVPSGWDTIHGEANMELLGSLSV